MRRRRLLGWASGGGLLAAAGAGAWRLPDGSGAEAMARLIERQLDGLALEPSGVRAYVQDVLRTSASRDRMVLKAYAVAGVTPAQSQRIERLVATYLLSTDLFLPAQQAPRPLRYLGLFSPVAAPCANPFSHLFHPPPA